MNIRNEFHTTQTDLINYNGEPFEIIDYPSVEKDKSTYTIKFNDDFELEAFADEIFYLEEEK